MAADPGEEPDVVDDYPVGLVQVEPLGHPQGDQGLPQRVLHRLGEPRSAPSDRAATSSASRTFVPGARAHGQQIPPPRGVAVKMPRSASEHGQPVYLQIPATDLAISARFYERVLGWRLDRLRESSFEVPGLIGQWITDRPASPEAGPATWIHVNDVAQTLAEAAKTAAAIRQPPTPDGPRVLALFSDPAGNVVGIAARGGLSTTTSPRPDAGSAMSSPVRALTPAITAPAPFATPIALTEPQPRGPAGQVSLVSASGRGRPLAVRA